MIASFTPLYFLSNGITQSQLGLLISANILTLALLDIPTGAIADTFGHKLSVFWGTVIWSLSFLILFLLKGFLVFLLSMILGGLGLALISGAMTSLIYDILDKQNKKGDFKKVYGRCNGIFLVASVIAASLGGFIYQYKPELIFLIAFIFTFIGALWIIFVKWNFVGEKPSIVTYFNKIKIGIRLTFNNKSLLSLIMISFGLSFGIFVLNNIKQPYLLNNGYSVSQIGIITGLISGISALFYLYGYRILKKTGDFEILIVISVVTVLTLILISYSNPLLGLTFLIIYQILPALRDPAITHLQQEQITDEQRATVNSTISFLVRLVVAIALPLWGIIIDQVGINLSLIYLGILTGIIAFSGLLLYRKSLSVVRSQP